MEYAYYSVISPEGCAAILWKSEDAREQAAAALKITAPELLGLGVVDEVISEPLGGAHRDRVATARTLREWIAKKIGEFTAIPTDELLKRRYNLIRKRGIVREGPDLPLAPPPVETPEDSKSS
jgi:acetyl-CoA carboxylase carboxyl transferase subunit alpha